MKRALVVPGFAPAVGRIAQLVEQLTLNQRVQGSNPCAPTNEIKGLLGPPPQKIPQKAFWCHLFFVTSIETALGAG